ncbi:polyketide cyclase [Paenibacillus albus]|uniref:Polyketide cyclase n=2 Tax=Paenibacillus albus TaxID=2495582 RepID=A0A3Q8X9P9_9BACL|nr:polyketide cyclase [Paenibacillus albus]
MKMTNELVRNAVTENDREIINWRVMHAPREVVFEAWRNPEQLASWWGPNGFTNTFQTFEFEQGGQWEFVMHGPDGTDYKNKSEFTVIEAPERVVFKHLNGPHFQMTAIFEEVDANNTKLTWRMLFDTAKEFEMVKSYAVEGNEQNFDRLQALLLEQRG